MASFLEFVGGFSTNLQAGILPNLGFWSYLLLALFVVVEGPVVTVLAGVAASAGFLKPDLVFLSAGMANLSADSIWYLVGLVSKKAHLLRLGRRFGIRALHLEKLQRNVRAHAFRFLFIAKITYGFAVPLHLTAGLSRIPWRRWFPPVLAGEVLWTGGLVLFGYYTTKTLEQIEKDFRNLALIFVVFALVLIFWPVHQVLSARGEQNDASDGEF
ncbi:MAG TPA: VTT domain-containing protein [Anaerolineales bacterium]|jgi:undecaprenyl-diphosphatase|nr:VTT domain-containing protein [Anaerolineales bacterium]